MTNNTSHLSGYDGGERIINAPSGSYFANALAFIVESINDDHFLGDIEALDNDSLLEFAEMYNFTAESLEAAVKAFRKAAFREVTGTR